MNDSGFIVGCRLVAGNDWTACFRPHQRFVRQLAPAKVRKSTRFSESTPGRSHRGGAHLICLPSAALRRRLR